jgi:hypothetical protein
MNNFIDFSESRINTKDFALVFSFADRPFVVSIVCSTREEGFLTDWVISGARAQDDKPRFLLRIQTGLAESKDDLETVFLEYWNLFIKELSFSSANQGGLNLTPNSIPKKSVELHAKWHLFAHDRLGHFGSSDITIASRTADMFLLMKSLGFVQAQKLVIEFESQKADVKVPASTTTNRLTTARKQGLIPSKKLDK